MKSLVFTALLLVTSLHPYTVAVNGPVPTVAEATQNIVSDRRGPEAVERTITAYTLRPEETDSTPCETALGPRVNICEWAKREQLCAANDYPLKTRLLVGDTECVVVDRLNPKYHDRVDLVMATVEEARQWGVKTLEVTIIK